MTPATVAVHAGTSATRLAAAGADGRPEVVATLPAGTSPAAAVESLHGDAPVPVVVLVHAPGQAADESAAALRTWAGAVLTVPAPLAVLAGIRGTTGPADPPAVPRVDPATGRRVSVARRSPAAPTTTPTPTPTTTPTSPSPGVDAVVRLVVDAGASGTGLTVVAGERAMPSHRVDVGGDRLDATLGAVIGVPARAARPVREALSLRRDVALPGGGRYGAERCREVLRPVLAELADAVAATVRRSGAAEVVLAGGLARTPLLAEMLDAAVDVGVRVAEAPESAAVLGALQAGERGVTAVPGLGRSPDAPPAHDPGPRRRFRLRGAPVAAALGIALVAAGTVAGRTPDAVPPPTRGTALVQYGYTATLPAGWEHTGGLPERRRTLLTRSGSPDGAELIAVERTPLGYDSALEPERARAELAAEFRRRAAGEGLRDLREDTVAGRPVSRYRQAGPGSRPDVDWFVLFDGTDELVVGCRYPDAPAVTAACAAVVGSARVTG